MQNYFILDRINLYSNTTFVKVKLDSRFDSWYWMTNSNTTFVKVKWNKYMENKNGNYIQIQHLLKLNSM